MIHLDTHVVLWLYAGQVERFPDAVREALEVEALAISPAVLLELQYLHEIGRITVPGVRVVEDLRDRIGLGWAEAAFGEVVGKALGQSWTRDPFDRLIAAHALADDAELLTADRALRAHLPTAFWEAPAPAVTASTGP